ncbi:MAG: leucine-rich repeat domain-containing protein [Firmicutes bacterium]|nr:leucine-rich repeat domain-containing protein [Bacillota bacterium]
MSSVSEFYLLALNFVKRVYIGLTAVSLFSTSTCSQVTGIDVQINETNFPDAKFRQFLSKQKYGSDGVITPSEIARIKKIYIQDMGIADLTGIKHFTALKELYARNNQIRSLDISGMTKLTKVILGSNQLTHINVSGSTNLRSLYCSNNQLTSINVSDLTNLKYLYLSANRFTSVDVSNLTNLVELYLGNNQFVSFDFSNLKNLVHLDLYNNQFTSVDVSELKKLKRFFCDHNDLSSLNLTGLTKLKKLVCNNQTPKLTLTAKEGNYSINIALNHPAGLSDGISYSNGMLTSINRSITESYFEVETGYGDTKLSGKMTFCYLTENEHTLVQ